MTDSDGDVPPRNQEPASRLLRPRRAAWRRPRGGGRRHHRADRAQRGGQDDAVQRGLRPGAARRRLGSLRRKGDRGAGGRCREPAGAGAYLPGGEGFSQALGVPAPHALWPRPAGREPVAGDFGHAGGARARGRAGRAGLGDGAVPQARSPDRQSRHRAVGRPEEASGNRSRADGRTAACAARRADRRRQSDPAERDRRAAARAAAPRHHRAADRARHGLHRRALRSGDRDGRGPGADPGHVRRGARRPSGARGLSRRERHEAA